MKENGELPLVSIIMPCYNAEKFVKHSINSIRGQSYGNIEIIAVNDCSKDDTLHVLQELTETQIKMEGYLSENH